MRSAKQSEALLRRRWQIECKDHNNWDYRKVDHRHILRKLGRDHRFQVKRANFGLLSSLDDNLGCHLWVNRAVIDVGAGFRERIGVAIIGIERLGFEYVGIARDDMWNVIMVRPCDCRSGSNCDVRAEAEVVYRDLGPEGWFTVGPHCQRWCTDCIDGDYR
jgi:hypothetical protein